MRFSIMVLKIVINVKNGVYACMMDEKGDLLFSFCLRRKGNSAHAAFTVLALDQTDRKNLREISPITGVFCVLQYVSTFQIVERGNMS